MSWSASRIRVGLAATAVLTLCATAPLAAQGTGTIRGHVTDATGQRAVSDVQVTVSGSQLGAVTNASGDYVITSVPAGTHQLTARRLGYTRRVQTVTVTAGADVRADFALAPAASQLDAIVVTGTAGAVEKRTVGNAITQLDVADLTAKTNVSNITEVLQARSPGVQIESGSGTVGTAADIRIRGASGFTVTPPVVYVDGVRMSTAGLGNFNPSGQGLSSNSGGQGANAFDLINPEDIESIEIIKGPAAATLYGADAAGGVIQIITKKGTRGQQKVQWNAHAELGRDDLGSVTLPTDYTTCDAAKQAAKQADGTPLWPGCQGVPEGTILSSSPLRDDPAALRNGGVRQFSLSARGGGDRFSYYVSGDHDDEQGVLYNSFDKRNSLRSNFSFTPNTKADFQVSLGIVDGHLRLPLDGESAQGLLFGAERAQPGKASTLPGQSVQGWPYVTPAESNEYDNETHSDRVLVGTTLNYQPFSWFRNRLTTGLDWTYAQAALFAPPNTPPLTGDTLGLTAQRVPRTDLYTLDYTGSIDHNFGRDLVSTTSFGSQVVANHTETLYASGRGLGSPDVKLIGSTATITASNTYSANNSLGYYGQEQLGWKNRLFVTGALRIDNNSSFGSDFKVMTYPKAQIAYTMSEEPALKSFFDLIRANSFKFRAAWGMAGRAPEPYAAARTYGIGVVTLGGTTSSGLFTGSYGNPNLKPERGVETEVGFDADFFNSRAGAEFTYYDKEMRDVLVSQSIAPSTGFSGSQLANIGATSNKGIELGLTATPVQLRNFEWDARLNLSTNHNKLLSFGDTAIKYQVPGYQSYGAVQRHVPGYPLGGYWAGFPKRNADGTPVLKPNGTVDTTASQYIGPAMPTRQVSFSNTLTLFRDFTVYALLDYQGGFYNYRGVELYRCGFSANCTELNDPNFPASEKVIYKGGLTSGHGIYIYKADFTKLRDLSLTYNLPQRLAARASAQRASITLAGHNLKLWSNYPGPDPEVNNYGWANAVLGGFARADIYAMPMTRRLSVTLNLTY